MEFSGKDINRSLKKDLNKRCSLKSRASYWQLNPVIRKHKKIYIEGQNTLFENSWKLQCVIYYLSAGNFHRAIVTTFSNIFTTNFNSISFAVDDVFLYPSVINLK